MEVLHLADTHVGYSAYNVLNEDGHNQREADVFSSFEQVVDFTLRHGPDLVLHSGDLFDTVRPSNRAISFVIGQLLRMSEAGIPFLAISGNHSTPRLRETGSVFKVLEHIENVHLAYKGRLETFEFGDLKVHALPHCVDKEIFEGELRSLKPDKTFSRNIALLHAGVIGLNVFKMNEFNEQVAPDKALRRGFDYVALGHYHEHCSIDGNIVYAGSTERLGFGEVGQPKGFVTLDLDTGKWEFNEIEARPMLDLGPVDCERLSSTDIFEAVQNNIERAEVSGAMVRQRLYNVKRSEYNLLDFSGLRKLARDSLHFELRADMQDQEQRVASSSAVFDTLEKEFVTFLSKVALEGQDRKALVAKGLEYLSTGGEG
jgi:exonuclease SbcD